MRLSVDLEGRFTGYKTTEKSWSLTTDSKFRAIYHCVASSDYGIYGYSLKDCSVACKAKLSEKKHIFLYNTKAGM